MPLMSFPRCKRYWLEDTANERTHLHIFIEREIKEKNSQIAAEENE